MIGEDVKEKTNLSWTTRKLFCFEKEEEEIIKYQCQRLKGSGDKELRFKNKIVCAIVTKLLLLI